MELVEPAVQPELVVDVLLRLAVVAQRPAALGERRVVGRRPRPRRRARRGSSSGRSSCAASWPDGSRRAARASSRRCTARSPRRRGARSAPAAPRAAIEVGAAAVEVHRDHRPHRGVRREDVGAAVEVEQAVLVHVHEHGDPARAHDAERRGEGAEGRREDLRARAAARRRGARSRSRRARSRSRPPARRPRTGASASSRRSTSGPSTYHPLSPTARHRGEHRPARRRPRAA